MFHRAFACGPCAAMTEALDAEARAVVNGEVQDAGRPHGNYGETVQMLAQLLGAVGEHLRRGDRILTGSVIQVPVSSGDEATAEIEGLGRVTMVISPQSG